MTRLHVRAIAMHGGSVQLRLYRGADGAGACLGRLHVRAAEAEALLSALGTAGDSALVLTVEGHGASCGILGKTQGTGARRSA